jgi:hypothetical protein
MANFVSSRRDFLAAATVSVGAAPLLARGAGTASTVEVDLAGPVRRMPSLSGFVHGLDNQTSPRLVEAMAPAFWRTGGAYGLKILPAVLRAGAMPIVVLSDSWGYPVGKPSWRAPYADLDGWSKSVAATVRKTQSAGAPRDTVYDLWNEPDGKDFWRGTIEQFLATFQAAHDVVRKLAPGARISGPSIANFDRMRVSSFVEACVARSIRLDILSWHEFRRPERLAAMTADIADMKRRFVMPGAAGLRAVHINEYGPERWEHVPGMAAAYLFHMERGGADAAARACWGPNGASSCWDGSVGSCLGAAGNAATPVGRVYQAYAETVNARLASRSGDDALAHFAGRDAARGSIVALVARSPSMLTSASAVTLSFPGKSLAGMTADITDLTKESEATRRQAILPGEAGTPQLKLGVLAPGAAVAVRLRQS